MKKIITGIIYSILIISCQQKVRETIELSPLEEKVYSKVTLEPVIQNSLQYTWNNKEVLKEKVVDRMETLEKWTCKGENPEEGISFELSKEQVFEGKTSIKLTAPTKSEVPLKYGQRKWKSVLLRRNFNQEDFSEFNRFVVNVFPDFPGHKKIHLLLIFHNEGSSPDKYFREGVHTVMLENHQWNEAIFELPHLERDKVTGISLLYRQQGNEAGASDTVSFYFDRLAWQKVNPDHFEGWDTYDEIVLSHSGYNSGSTKTAFTSTDKGELFQVIALKDNKPVLEKNALRKTSEIGEFMVFDFSNLKVEGDYKLVYGELESKPFSIKSNVWKNSVLKTINQYYNQRCGYEIPGIHDACHQDWYTVFEGDTIAMSGGWHDAGDLSQSYMNTAEAVAALYLLAEKSAKSDPQLAQRMKEEARWGLKWMHKNRFGKGKKVTWTTIDNWSDGKIGTVDDKVAKVDFRTNYNFYGVFAESVAYQSLNQSDKKLVEVCLKNAKEDWYINLDSIQKWNTELLTLATWSGSKLYEVTKDEKVKKELVKFARLLMENQQKDLMDWSIPLNGFFYRDASKDQFFGYSHHVKVISPISGLVEMVKLFPDHEDTEKWKASVTAYANYLKQITRLTGPYQMIPAGIFKVGGKYDEQVKNGIQLDENHYFRLFPAWGAFRGNTSIILSKAIGLAQANQILDDPELHDICQSQLEWVVGKNPFNQSLMFGEGYNFSPQYSAMCGDIVGGLPVGILTQADKDLPYWQPAVWCNYKEIWIHPSNRWLMLLEALD